MDFESLDRCIQTALSSLYPPFQDTSPTILSQVLSVVEKCYRGDSLYYLIHFLLPAKQFLQTLQYDACLPYSGRLFRHEGWPLCVHEKVVVQLCPLDQRFLCPGDFYLLVSPAAPSLSRALRDSCRRSSFPCLVVCSLSPGGHHVEQQEVFHLALPSLFSMAWLDSVNRERKRRGAPRLDRCILSSNGDVFRVPWEDVVYPEFISRHRSIPKDQDESPDKTSHHPPEQGVQLLPSPIIADQSVLSSDTEESEGEYVELTELPLPRFSPQKGSLTQSIGLQRRSMTTASTLQTVHTQLTTNTQLSNDTQSNAGTQQTIQTLHTTNTNQPVDTLLTTYSQPSTHIHEATDSQGITHVQQTTSTLHTPHTQPTTNGQKSSHTQFTDSPQTTDSASTTQTRTTTDTERTTDTQSKTNTDFSPHTQSITETQHTTHIDTDTHTQQASFTQQTAHTQQIHTLQAAYKQESAHTQQTIQTSPVKYSFECCDIHTQQTDTQDTYKHTTTTHSVLLDQEVSCLMDKNLKFCPNILSSTPPEVYESSTCRTPMETECADTAGCSNPNTQSKTWGNDFGEERRDEDLTKKLEGQKIEETGKRVEEGFLEEHKESEDLDRKVEDDMQVEQEVKVTVQQSHASRDDEEKFVTSHSVGGKEEKREQESHIHTHSEDFYCETEPQSTKTEVLNFETLEALDQAEDSHCEKKESLTKDSCVNDELQHMHSEDSCENFRELKQNNESSEIWTESTHDKQSNCENKPLLLHSEDSYFQNDVLPPQSEETYSENKISTPHYEESFSENHTEKRLNENFSSQYQQNVCPEESNCENQLVLHSESYNCENNSSGDHLENHYFENTLPPQSENLYCENRTLPNPSENAHFENKTLLLHSDNSCCADSMLPTSEKSCCEHPSLPKSEETICENNLWHPYSEGPCLETKPLPLQLQDSNCEKHSLPTQSKNCYFENMMPLTSVESNPENLLPQNCEDSSDKNEMTLPQSEGSSSSVIAVTDQHACQEEQHGSGQGQELKNDEKGVGRRCPVECHTEDYSPELSSGYPDAVSCDPSSSSNESSQSSFSSVLLSSGVLCLPGTRDRAGHPLLTVRTKDTLWLNPNCDNTALLNLLLYYTSTLSEDVRELGLTVLMDISRTAPAPALLDALRALQEKAPGSIHTLLLLTNKDSSLYCDKPLAVKVEVSCTLKSIHKHVDLHQLPTEFGGSLFFSQSNWVFFRSRMDQLTSQCENVISLLQKTINTLENTALPATAEEAEQLLSRFRAVMRSVLEDSRLVKLQLEGGASLSLLRREEGSATEAQRGAVDGVSSLYEQVDELLHRLVTLSNDRTRQLEFILDFSNLEMGFAKVASWLQEVGDVHLRSLNEPEDSLELLKKKQLDFKDLFSSASEHCKHGEALLAHLDRWSDMPYSADLRVYEVKIHSFWAQLQDFSQRVNITGMNIDRAVHLYTFLDQAYGWALEGMRQLAGISMDDCRLPDKCQAVINSLEDYHRQHPPIPDTCFQDMKAVAGELRGEQGVRQWHFAWSKCQETQKMMDRKMEAALKTRDSPHRRRSDSVKSSSSGRTLSGLFGLRESFDPPEEDIISQHMPFLQRLFRSDATSSPTPSHRLTPSPPTSCRRQPLRKTQSFDCAPTPEGSYYGVSPRALSEPVRRGNTGVFIRGLEVSSSEAADHTLCPRMVAHGWPGQGPRCSGSLRTMGSPSESRPRGSKLRHIMEEMVTTEREYVRSLHYVVNHYFPEMERHDVPQELRGKRSVVFGNLEKLHDFHSQFFLRELEACRRHPLRAPHCFLRHQEQFSLYALYSKNKPKSDALLANHRLSFFRRKQQELGDKMDLSSYLLKPIQRMSKYALLLSDIIKEVGVAQEADLSVLLAATHMVKFQLRHGNDLLAMDAIRDCDVNLKEQGQLIRQDEFTVWSGRRKCQRHIFLFEELVLFSKPKKVEGGLDVFIYKHSFKTADIGLTESAGEDGLKFEIWFRRRTAKNQTFILQAAITEVKQAWTSEIARLLWTQAARNKEMRLKEMVSMGVGNKPFLDIQPSDAAISDRAVHCIMKSRGARTRASIAVSVFDHSNPFKCAAVSSESTTSGPSSCSLLGPLNLHMYSQGTSSSPPLTVESSFTSCVEEDEQEHETSSQPSITTDSSGSSSHCFSGSTGSDSGCVSANLQEVLQDEPNPPGSAPSNKTPRHRRYTSKSSPVSPATIV